MNVKVCISATVNVCLSQCSEFESGMIRNKRK